VGTYNYISVVSPLRDNKSIFIVVPPFLYKNKVCFFFTYE
jgi:hypothetical protein